MFSTFDLCLLLYVIRLAGWLKHCNFSLSHAVVVYADPQAKIASTSNSNRF